MIDRMPTTRAVLAEFPPDRGRTPIADLERWAQRLVRAVERDRALSPVILFCAVRRPVLVLAEDEWRYDVVARGSLCLALKGRSLKLTNAKGRPLSPGAIVKAHGEEIDRAEFDLFYHRAEAFKLERLFAERNGAPR